MRKYFVSTCNLARFMKEERTIYAVILLPIVLVIAYLNGADALYRFFEQNAPESIYGIAEPLIIMSIMSIMPLLIGFCSAFVILDELENRIQRYYCITPLGKTGYLFSRIMAPGIIIALVNLLLLIVIRPEHYSILQVLGVAVCASLEGIVICLFISDFSSNRVEGMAFGKISGFMLAVMFIPYVSKWNVIKIFMLFPSYWYGRFVLDLSVKNFACCLTVSLVWVLFLVRKFIVQNI